MNTLMLKQKLKDRSNFNLKSKLGAGLAVILLIGAPFYGGFVKADSFDEQINALRQQNASNQATANQLAAQASSYQDTIYRLQTQINALQAAIDDNQQKIEDLKNQIVAAQTELDHEKKVLGENIKTMYLEGQISTLEILASSKDLSEFVDKQQFRNSVQEKVKTTMARISSLKQQLQQQQQQVESRLKDQQSQQADLQNTRAQQNQLLALTESQKASYDQQIRSNNQQIAILRAQQLAANRRLGGNAVAGDPNHGGYPGYLDRASQDSLIDPWGMLNRECVSYTAWKVYQTHGYMPYWGGVGNANEWPADAVAAGIPTGSVPRPGSVAISMGGFYGHAMWVEAVNGNTIYVSQYNYDLAGHYSEMTINGSGLIYIYFGG